MEFQAIYLPIGVGTFHLPSAEALFQKSAALLKTFEPDVVCPQEMLLSVDKLDAFLEGRCADFAIVQNVTFANAAYISEILRRLDCPILLWTLREPVVDGTRLRLNSLTGAFSAANTLKSFGRPFEYVFGSPDEARVQSAVSAVFAAARMKRRCASCAFYRSAIRRRASASAERSTARCCARSACGSNPLRRAS